MVKFHHIVKKFHIVNVFPRFTIESIHCTKNSRNVCLQYTNLTIFQARQILEVEFERLVTEGTHRQLGIPSDGRNSASSMGSLGDRSISPVS